MADNIRTRTICGHKIKLSVGHRYRASRPMNDGRKVFPVAIREVSDGFDLFSDPVLVIPDLSYDGANSMLKAFNSGASSWKGRVWK